MTITKTADPLTLFGAWLDEAAHREPADSAAVCLATADAEGMPAARMVLLKGYDPGGFVFYTNTESDKAEDLAANPKAALCFHWKSLRRQIRVQGLAGAVTAAEADAYFATRPRQAQIGAWASAQSRPLAGKFALERKVARAAARFGIAAVPRPPFWSGYRIAPLRIEFWKNGAFRLHDRLLYHRPSLETDDWQTMWLYP